MGVLSDLEPKEVFAYFEEISAIPRASRHEEKISDYCAAFARDHHLKYYQDEMKNIIIIKDATEGYEQEDTLILQGHLDMVCEKEPGSGVNFDTDGLELIVDGDVVTANGTTLGGDDGIAIAYALALLASDSIPHPKLEVIFTVCEEVGMDGASAIDVSMLEGRKLINLDSEEEGILLAGCAGGASVLCSLPVHKMPAAGKAVQLTVTGLTGGHSGTEIDKGRANADLLMGRILIHLFKTVNYKLAELCGGRKDNAIPRECRATICIAEKDIPAVKEAVASQQEALSKEYAITDKAVKLDVAETELPQKMFDEVSTRQAVLFLNSLPNGIQAMSADVEGLVETSLNLGILKTEERQLTLRYAVRSSVGTAQSALIEKMAFITQGLGGGIEVSGQYPAWEFRRDSKLREKMAAVYEKMYGKKPQIEAIHAGVECGLLAGKLQGLDCISIGPDMDAIHTTEETLGISSTKRVWEYLLEVLKTKG